MSRWHLRIFRLALQDEWNGYTKAQQHISARRCVDAAVTLLLTFGD